MIKNATIKKIIITAISSIFIVLIVNFLFSNIMSYYFDNIKINIYFAKNNLSIKNEKILKITTNDDLIGDWKDMSFGFNERYECKIDNDSIIIYKYDNGQKNIYWCGSFLTDFDIKKENKIISKNYITLTKYFETVPEINEKEFTYNDGTITFISKYGDANDLVVLHKYDTTKRKLYETIRLLKYVGDRRAFFDKSTNKKITLKNYEIEYPMYFDEISEETKKDILDNFLTVDKTNDNFMNENNRIVLNPTNKDAHAEIYIGEYDNANIESMGELYSLVEMTDVDLQDQKVYYGLKEDKSTLQSHYFEIMSKQNDANENEKYLTKIYSNEVIDIKNNTKENNVLIETWILFRDTNQVLDIAIVYGFDDATNYDYILDYESIIKNVRSISVTSKI